MGVFNFKKNTAMDCLEETHTEYALDVYLKSGDTAGQWRRFNKKTKHSTYLVFRDFIKWYFCRKQSESFTFTYTEGKTKTRTILRSEIKGFATKRETVSQNIK